MQAIKDAAIVLILILLAATIRVTPLEDVTDLIPETEAAAAERSAETAEPSPVVRPSSNTWEPGLQPLREYRPFSPPPMGSMPPPSEAGTERDTRAFVLIQVKRDRPIEAVIESCPTDPDRPRKAPAAGSAC
jgi:hypothetical protein